MKINFKDFLGKLRFAGVQSAKGLPAAGIIVSGIEAITGKDLSTGESKDSSWSRVVLKALGLVVALYLLSKSQIEVDEVLRLINRLV
jgi:hypothetical protein